MSTTATDTATPHYAQPTASSNAMSRKSLTSLLPHAKLILHPSAKRGHADHGWLNTHHTFSFASYHDPRYVSHGALRVLNEDRVAPKSGFPTHPHRDAEIFSYILSGELTHRDSLSSGKDKNSLTDNDFFRMKRGDVQFTTGGTGIAHSEQNEHATEPVHFLQIWVLPWKRNLMPNYHTKTFDEARKREGWVTIVSPLKAGQNATPQEEKAAEASVLGSIPIHADFLMGAAIIGEGKSFGWKVGGPGGVVSTLKGRKAFVHLPASKHGESRVRINGQEEAGGVVLKEGDGVFVSGVNAGDVLNVESVGEGEMEVVLFDSGDVE